MNQQIEKLKAEFKALVDEEAELWKQYVDMHPWRMTTDNAHIEKINQLDEALKGVAEKNQGIREKLGWEKPHGR